MCHFRRKLASRLTITFCKYCVLMRNKYHFRKDAKTNINIIGQAYSLKNVLN